MEHGGPLELLGLLPVDEPTAELERAREPLVRMVHADPVLSEDLPGLVWDRIARGRLQIPEQLRQLLRGHGRPGAALGP